MVDPSLPWNADAATNEASCRPASVLLVDDRPANLVALEATLRPLGIRTVTAVSGPEALRRLLAEEFALVLLDVQMPGMDGFETATLMKRHPRTAHVPIIFVTAIHREAAHLFTGYERGAVDYMTKPFDPNILRSKVRVFVDLFIKERQVREQSALLYERESRDREHRTEERFRALLDSMPLCVWALGADGTPVYANRSWLEYAGADAGAQGPMAALHPEDEAAVRTDVQLALLRGEPIELEYRLRSARDGSYRWHAVRFLPQRDPEGVISGWIGTATDIENFKRAQDAHAELAVKEREAREAAEAANRAKDEFLATLSHELRTPLNAMVGWTHMLRSRTLSAEKEQKALETIERNARAQAELIEDILDVSRIIAGKLRIEIHPVDLQSIIDVAVDAVRPAAEAKGITLERRTGALPERFPGDAVRLQQAIWNLLSNGIKFTPAGGRVELDVRSDGRQVVVEVHDSGCGIAPDFKPFVFDRFRQLDSSSRRTHGGLGIGLAIVRHIVELHGGSVACESAGTDQGATFTLRLPIRAEVAPPIAVAPEVRQAGAMRPSSDEMVDLTGIKVLLVDDEPDARELLTEVLQQCGAVVVATHSADEAVRLIPREHPAVLLSDIGLPGEDGYKLISRVRALSPEDGGNLPAAAITAYARSDDARRALAAGYQRHAPKPIQPTTLAALVAGLANMHPDPVA
ncbi:MAG TPA: response regulator [Polyangia bacterium]|jgi:PAS domain S-box-containing protein|nr:response regulator [Polyangia bacterium]